MTRTQYRIAQSLRATMRRAQVTMANVHSPQGLSAEEYGAAWSEHRQAQTLAQYLCAQLAGLDRQAFANAAGIDAYARTLGA